MHSSFFISVGVMISVAGSARERTKSVGAHPMHTYVRRMFGGWRVVALEFQLAADIVGTIISPTSGQLIQLASVALIRTFLNYFLNKELREDLQMNGTGKEAVRTDGREMSFSKH